MAKYEALTTLTVLPSTTISPGETVELGDEAAIILFDKGCILPAVRRISPAYGGGSIEPIELQEYEHGTNDE